jgi:hypothetical protein
VDCGTESATLPPSLLLEPRNRAYSDREWRTRATRRAEIEENLADNLLDQAKALNRDLRFALEEAKRAKSLPAFLGVADRLQKQLALQSQLLERAGGVGEREYVFTWQEPAVCEHCGHDVGACERAVVRTAGAPR